MSAAFDTNILAYAAGLRRSTADEAKIVNAEALIVARLASEEIVLPAQVLAELHHLLRRKARLPADVASARVTEFADAARIVATDAAILASAFALAADHRLQTYDAIILAAAAHAGCDVLYSEDLQNGFEWNGVLVIDPFG